MVQLIIITIIKGKKLPMDHIWIKDIRNIRYKKYPQVIINDCAIIVCSDITRLYEDVHFKWVKGGGGVVWVARTCCFKNALFKNEK